MGELAPMTERDRALRTALHYLAAVPRTVAQVRRRLTHAGIPETTIDEVIEELAAVGYLDDTRFTEQYVEGRLRAQPMGRVRLEADLRRRGVSSEEAEAALAGISEEDEVAAATALAERHRDAPNLGDPAARRRLAGFLMRRGYSGDVIEQVMATLLANRD